MDTWVAKQIAREIGNCGATPFLDEADIDVGSDFEEDILAFLERAHELVVLLTPWALDRPYVWAELGAAWGRRIPIVAFLHGITPAELQSRSGVPIFLKKRDLLPLNEIETYLQQLRERVKNDPQRNDGVKGMSGPKVFISYSHNDSEWVREFANTLKDLNVAVWLDEWEIAAGESLVEALETGLRGSDVIVAVISPNNVASPNVLFELGFAVGMGKRLVPILSRDVVTSTIPFDLRSRRFLIQGRPDETAREVAAALKREEENPE